MYSSEDKEAVVNKPINTLDFNIFQYIDELDRKSAFLLISAKTIRVGPQTVNS